MTGLLVLLGRPPVEVRIDNRGDFRHGVAVLGRTDLPALVCLKSHFVTTPSYQGAFTVRVRSLGGTGDVPDPRNADGNQIHRDRRHDPFR